MKKEFEEVYKSDLTEYPTLINDLLKILEEENLNMDIYHGIALFKTRLEIAKKKYIPPSTFLKYIEAVEAIIKKHNESKVIKENKENKE